MANGNKGGFSFDAPVWLIVLGWVIAPPVGAVMTVLKLLSSVLNSPSSSENRRFRSAFDRCAENMDGNSRSAQSENPNYTHYYAHAPNGSSTSRTYASANGSTTSRANETAGAKKAAGSSTSRIYASGKTDADYAAEKAEEKKASAKKKPKTSVLSTLAKIFGYSSLALSLIGFFATMSTFFTVEWYQNSFPLILFFMLLGGGLLWLGYSKQTRDVRLDRIRILIGERESYNLSKLASICGTSLSRTKRDVQRLINKGEFGADAYLDNSTNNFMRSSTATPDDPAKFDYKNLYGDSFDKKKKKEAPSSDAPDAAEGMKGDNEEFKTIIREIRRLNDEIADEPVSARIDKIEEYTKTIFDYVSEHPEAMPQIRTFLNYYLPTTMKLLESYSRIEKVGVAGENMKKSKNSIEETLSMLETGFKLEIDELFKSESLDISTDISVLEAMMNKDGLNGKTDFKVPKADEEAPAYTDEITSDFSSSSGTAALEK